MVSASMTVQHTKWLEGSQALPWRHAVPSLNILLTSTCWRNDHNGFSHQGPGLIDTVISKRGSVARIYFPPDANCLLSVADHCLRSRDYVNLIVIDKQPQLQYLDADAAAEHCAAGAGTWAWAGTEEPGSDPDVVLACAGDIPTMETLAAAALLREHVPDLRVRVVNVVDLMRLAPSNNHPHGSTRDEFVELFTESVDVVFAFHGYAGAVHGLLHGQPDADRFHVRGYREQGTTTTPFDMVVLNEMSRYHLVAEALRRSRRLPAGSAELANLATDQLAEHHSYIRGAPRGPAAGPRLDVAGLTGEPRPRAVRERRLLVVEAGAVRVRAARVPRSSGAGRAAPCPADAVELRPALDELLAQGFPRPTAVGHRVVHGGDRHEVAAARSTTRSSPSCTR